MNGETPPAIDLGHLLNRAEHLAVQDLERILDGTQDDLVREQLRRNPEVGAARYVRSGGYWRTLHTRLGTVTVRIQRVLDRLSRVTWSPLLLALGIGKKRYTRELRLAAAELATRTSYEEASQALERTLGFRIPRRTIWNFVQEIAGVVKVALRRAPPSPPERQQEFTHLADSTFVRGQRRRQQHEIEVGIRQGQDHRLELVGVRVGARPGASLEGEEVLHLTTDDAPGLRAFGAEYQQLCHVHFVRHLADLLGEEGVSLLEREGILAPVRALLAHLRNSVEAHRHDGNGAAVTFRVQATLDELSALGQRLAQGGCPQSSRFVLREMRALVVFAQVGGGLWMPATSNGVERVMGMIADRCKRKWAHWNSGLQNLILTMLARKIRPRVYGLAVRRYLRSGSY